VAYLELTCRTVVLAVFLAAAAGKAHPRALRAFVSSLTSVRWLPDRLAGSAAAAVIAVEGCTVLALSASRTLVVGYGLAVAALGAFTATAADAMRRGRRLRCRCFGADAGPIGWSELARNCALIAIAVAGLGARLGGGIGAHAWPGPVVTATAVATGLALAVVAIRWDDLAYLFGPSPRRRLT
jgi:methylamine utilization protein MauE